MGIPSPFSATTSPPLPNCAGLHCGRNGPGNPAIMQYETSAILLVYSSEFLEGLNLIGNGSPDASHCSLQGGPIT